MVDDTSNKLLDISVIFSDILSIFHSLSSLFFIKHQNLSNVSLFKLYILSCGFVVYVVNFLIFSLSIFSLNDVDQPKNSTSYIFSPFSTIKLFPFVNTYFLLKFIFIILAGHQAFIKSLASTKSPILYSHNS